MRDTLKKYFASAASCATETAKFHKAKMDAEEEGSDRHDLHKGEMDSHLAHAQTCVECAKACGEMPTRKIAGMDDEIMPLPEGFSRIAGDAPTLAFRAVPCTGSPQLSTAPVAEEFGFLAQVEGGE
jgi:hypothetical protein